MLETVNRIAASLGVEPRMIVLGGLVFGAFLVILSFVVTARERSAAQLSRRMRGAGGAAIAMGEAGGPQLFVDPEQDPSGLAKAFLPTEVKKRNKVRRDLAHAGFDGPNAVIWYLALRIGAGLVLPALLAALVVFRASLPLPGAMVDWLGQFRSQQLMLGFAAMILVGFYGPAIWLSARASDRRDRVELTFPNALDLLQVSIEAGLGFDAALSRVAEELHEAGPEISTEFKSAQREILAGRDREAAYRAMADRLGIDEAYAFINVVLQSMRFGTSMSQALLVYSADMRQRREIRAQEKANKLPVYMSAVMAGLMMPALLIVTIGPVVLRYIDTFGK